VVEPVTRHPAHMLSALQDAARSLTDVERRDVDTGIQRIVDAAVETVVPAGGGGISRTDEGTVPSAFGTSEDVRGLDELQARLRQGPCISAAGHPPEGGQVYARDLGGSDRDRWPAFAPQATALGYRSMLSTQLSAAPGRHSALNLYAREPDAFDDAAQDIAALFSLHAATLLFGAVDAEHLRGARETRDLIGQAEGVLTERFRLSDGEAFRMLVEVANTAGTTLVETARWLLDDAQRTISGPLSGQPARGAATVRTSRPIGRRRGARP
jgi:hypothetical protein